MFSRVLSDPGQTTCSLDLKHVEHQTRENICVWKGEGNFNRVDDTSAWRAARRLDGPSAGVFAGLARGKLLKKQAETPRVPLG